MVFIYGSPRPPFCRWSVLKKSDLCLAPRLPNERAEVGFECAAVTDSPARVYGRLLFPSASFRVEIETEHTKTNKNPVPQRPIIQSS